MGLLTSPMNQLDTIRDLLQTTMERESIDRKWRDRIKICSRVGCPVTEIARAAGVSRQAIYDILRKD